MGINTCIIKYRMLTAADFRFVHHVAHHNLSYATVEEFNARKALFLEVDAAIEEINANPEHTFTVGHNKFSTWTEYERKQMLGYRHYTPDEEVEVENNTTNADSVDWVTAGAVTGVKDQGQCGSCWSFSTTGAMEGAHFVATGELLSFSEQQLVDCATGIYLNMGCNGGNPLWAYRYLKKNYAELETEYPYTSGNGDDSTDCLYDSHSKTSVEVSASASVAASNPDQMKAALAQQPLAVLVEADKMAFQTYQSGVLTS